MGGTRAPRRLLDAAALRGLNTTCWLVMELHISVDRMAQLAIAVTECYSPDRLPESIQEIA